MKQQVIFVAYGTRGDVQPLACLAKHMQHHAQPCPEVVLVTHAAHQEWLRDEFFGLAHRQVDTLPARTWGEMPTPSHLEQFGGFEQHLETVRAVHASITSSSSPARLSQPSIPSGATVLIVFNLFALECFHIVEALGPRAHCVAAAPYLIPYACPTRFQRAFTAAMPELFAALHQTEPSGSVAPDVSENTEVVSRGKVTWSEVQHWLWPLFTDRWSPLRAHLGLPAWPMHVCGPDGRLHPLDPLPPAPQLLYGFSPLFVPRLAYWPASVTVCGFWAPAACCGTAPTQLPEDLHALISSIAPGSTQAEHLQGPSDASVNNECPAVSSKLGCIDLGSMGRLGLLQSPGRLLLILARALDRMGMRALLLTAGWEEMQEAHAQLPPSVASCLVPYARAAPHTALLPHVSFLLHPGGSGSTAAALLSGVPQVTLPLHFDQYFHSERLEYLGLAPPALRAASLLGKLSSGSQDEPAHQQEAETQDSKRIKRETQADGHRPRDAVGASSADVDLAVQDVVAAVQQALKCAPACLDFARDLRLEAGLDVGVGLLEETVGLIT